MWSVAGLGTYLTRPAIAPGGFSPQSGMFDGSTNGRTNRQIRLTDVQDGLTNTVMIGEVLQDRAATYAGLSGGGDASAFSTTGRCRTHPTRTRFTRPRTVRISRKSTCPVPGRAGRRLTLRSHHTGGANVVLGHASVRLITQSIKPATWLLMGSINDGAVIQLN